jgi:hypothetical protein
MSNGIGRERRQLRRMALPAAPARRGGGDGSSEYGWRWHLGGEPRRLA